FGEACWRQDEFGKELPRNYSILFQPESIRLLWIRGQNPIRHEQPLGSRSPGMQVPSLKLELPPTRSTRSIYRSLADFAVRCISFGLTGVRGYPRNGISGPRDCPLCGNPRDGPDATAGESFN